MLRLAPGRILRTAASGRDRDPRSAGVIVPSPFMSLVDAQPSSRAGTRWWVPPHPALASPSTQRAIDVSVPQM